MKSLKVKKIVKNKEQETQELKPVKKSTEKQKFNVKSAKFWNEALDDDPELDYKYSSEK